MNLKGLTKTLTELETLQQLVSKKINDLYLSDKIPIIEDEKIEKIYDIINQAKELLEEIKNI